MADSVTQPVQGVQHWRDRMKAARKSLPKGVGQQDVIEWIAREEPNVDRLTNWNRWKNAWLGRTGSPQFTLLVEKAAIHFKQVAETTNTRLGKQRLGSSGRKKAITQST